jgi:hypothetical protein
MTRTMPGAGEPLGVSHLGWIPGAAGVGFLASFVFTDWLRLPATASQLVYVILVVGFLSLYVQRTAPPVRAILRRRLGPGLALGVLGGLTLAWRVWADPPSTGPTGIWFVWDLVWRGVVYGTIDGLLLSAFPWLVTWRALGGETAAVPLRVGLSLLALGCGLGVTSAYHLGYPDFRGPKLAQATLGNAIATLPTLLAATPVASPLAHAILHVVAVVHDPQSDLFLPPHGRPAGGDDRLDEARQVTPVVVDFPLRGTWRVFQPPGHTRHAYDFVAVGADGRYVSRPWSAYLVGAGPAAGWSGWGRPVHAPFDGTVVAMSDGWPDRETVNVIRDGLRPFVFPPKLVKGDIRPFAGNYLIIQSGAVAMLLAHLRRGSLTVTAGQHVVRGQLVGAVGNSGNSLAPHLHVQLMDGPNPLTARVISFRLRGYERWAGGSWEAVDLGVPAAGERIQVR